MNAAVLAQAENTRLLRQFGDDLRTMPALSMPALWRRYLDNLSRIRSAMDLVAAKRRYEVTA